MFANSSVFTLVLQGCPRTVVFLQWFYKVVSDKGCFYIGFTRLSADNRHGHESARGLKMDAQRIYKRTHKKTHKRTHKKIHTGLTKYSQTDSQKDSQRIHTRIHKRIHKRTHKRPHKRIQTYWLYTGFTRLSAKSVVFYIGFTRLSAKSVVFILVLQGCPRTIVFLHWFYNGCPRKALYNLFKSNIVRGQPTGMETPGAGGTTKLPHKAPAPQSYRLSLAHTTSPRPLARTNETK